MPVQELVATLADATTGAIVETTGGGVVHSAVDLAFKVSPTSLPVGDYTVTCSLRNASSGSVLTQSTHNVTRVDDNALQPTAWIDENQRLIHRGKPKFVIGLYMSWIPNDPGDPGWSTPAEDIDLIANSSFNTIMPYQAPANESLLDTIAAAGLQVIFSTKDTYAMNNSEAFVKAQVAKWRKHEAVLGWYLNDELMGPRYLQALEDHYRWTVSGDPDHPAWAVLSSAATGSLRDYISTTDILGTDDYTITDGGPGQVSMGSGRQMDAIRQQTDSSVAIWEVLQMTNMRVYHKDCSDCITPTFDMERSITWQAIVRGANGVVFYSFFDMMSGCHRTGTCPLDVSNMTQWARMSTIAAEVERFAPALLSDAGAAPQVTVVNATGGVPSWVTTRERWEDDAPPGTMLIFAANDGDGGGVVTFVLNGGLIAHGGHVEVVSETPPRRISIEAGSDRFVDASNALDVRVYKLRASS